MTRIYAQVFTLWLDEHTSAQRLRNQLLGLPS